MKPPFSYYGGKQKIINHIVPHIPQHTVYVEPFCGGATLLFAKPDFRSSNNSEYRECINDTNEDIHNFFVQLRDNGKPLCEMLNMSLYSQKEYHIAREYKGEDNLKKAYYFFVNIMQSFANKLNSGWGISRYGQNSSYVYFQKVKDLPDFIKRMQDIYISCEDALTCIKRWDSTHTFFYCDPPYPNTNQGHYKGYTQEHYNQLIDALNDCKGSFMLSCYDNENSPKNCEKYEIHTVTSASNTNLGCHRDERIECIWVRQPQEECRKEILDIYKKRDQLEFQY